MTAYNFLVMAACVVMTVGAVYYFRFDTTRHNRRTVQFKMTPDIFLKTNKSYKMIHLHEFPWYYELKMGGEHFKGCPTHRCTYSDKPEAIELSDAVIFYTDHKREDSPPQKANGQVWVFFSVESPINSFNSGFGGWKWEGTFNWTMTYRLDSDIKFGYGDVLKGGSGIKKNYTAIAKSKTKLIAWFVSNCDTQSKRMKFVRLLQKFVPVDIYGQCSHMKCAKNKNQECLQMLERDYKFFLSFENSLCDDYLTEKVLRTLKLDIVPIVRGGANYSAVLPNKMVINTASYASVNDLAQYLKYLDSHIEEYVSYLAWKDSYHVVEPQPFPHCDLCERIHHHYKWTNSYPNVAHWWNHGRCHEPTDIRATLV